MKVRGAGRRASVVFRLLWWVASCGLKWTLRCRRVLNVTTGKETRKWESCVLDVVASKPSSSLGAAVGRRCAVEMRTWVGDGLERGTRENRVKAR